MRRTLVIASLCLIAAGTVHAQSKAAEPSPGAKAILGSYENGCSTHEKGSAGYLKCRADGYKEVSSNCEQLQQMAMDPKKATTSGIQQKLEMWCGAKKHYNASN